MKESVGTALSWIKANSVKIGIVKTQKKSMIDVSSETISKNKFHNFLSDMFRSEDLHVHFPAASVPKDGPSAGVTITTALVSLFTGRRVKSDFAMTGEITLQGLVMPVGGIKEKCIAAHRNKIRNVILPIKNENDIKDIPDDLRNDMKIYFATRIEDVLALALEDTEDQEFLN